MEQVANDPHLAALALLCDHGKLQKRVLLFLKPLIRIFAAGRGIAAQMDICGK